MDMDMWKYFGITHTDHTVMNPMSLAKTKELIDLLRLLDGGRVLDVACGKAEFLCLVAERYEVTGTNRSAFSSAPRARWAKLKALQVVRIGITKR